MSRRDAVSRTPWCLALGLALAWVPSLAAQDAATTPTVEPGDRIRFIAPPRYPSLVESELVSLDAYTLRSRARGFGPVLLHLLQRRGLAV